MEELLDLSSNNLLAVIVYVFILSFHLLAATILVSVFIALILDNLDLEEELKIVKQRRQRDEAGTKASELPLRIEIFNKFPSSPKVIAVKHVEYVVPKIRETFVSFLSYLLLLLNIFLSFSILFRTGLYDDFTMTTSIMKILQRRKKWLILTTASGHYGDRYSVELAC